MSTIGRVLFLALLLAPAATAGARDTLGVFEGWGAFRDSQPPRCFAIAEPDRHRVTSAWRAFATVATWPGQAVRGQIHIRLSRISIAGMPILLTIGDRRFALIGGGGADAWAPDTRADAAIVAAMRGTPGMSVSALSPTGRFTDTYRLNGAATAIDAATLGCARRR